MSATRNLFRIGRQLRNEDQLTEMLVWLAASVPEVCQALHELAFDHQLEPLGDVTVTTQHSIATGRLDALLRSKRVALIVESKTDSSYGDDQIGRYLRWLDQEVGHVANKGLLTLTARPAPWPLPDQTYADEHNITTSARLWEELHAALEPIVLQDGGLAGQLTREFLEMLGAENLVPTQPLSSTDLGQQWADSWTVIRRYREFFEACKDSLGEALAATPLKRSSSSDRADWFWQDYDLGGGTRLVVGIFYTDEYEKAPGFVPARRPVLWMAAMVDDPDNWPQIAGELEAAPPTGWQVGKRWYRERPNVWRPLPPLLTATTFDAQRESLANAVAAGRNWVQDALDAAHSLSGDDGRSTDTSVA